MQFPFHEIVHMWIYFCTLFYNQENLTLIRCTPVGDSLKKRQWEVGNLKKKKRRIRIRKRGKTGGRPGGFLKCSFGRVKVVEAKLELPHIGWKAERCTCSSIESSGGELNFCEWVGWRPEKYLFDVPSCLNGSCLGLLFSQVTVVFLGCPVTQKEEAKESSILPERHII